MPVSYTIQADVVDITIDSPKAGDVFLVDTNVWYWMTYPKAVSYVPSQRSDYPNYLKTALEIGSQVHHSGLSLAELAHIIEDTELKIYRKSVSFINRKEYRHNLDDQRTQVVDEIKAAWGQVTSLANDLNITIDAKCANSALSRLQTEKVDGYDLFILESMKNNKIDQVITDDGDFATVPNIQVFTANHNVIESAKAQGKLLLRP